MKKKRKDGKKSSIDADAENRKFNRMNPSFRCQTDGTLSLAHGACDAQVDASLQSLDKWRLRQRNMDQKNTALPHYAGYLNAAALTLH